MISNSVAQLGVAQLGVECPILFLVSSPHPPHQTTPLTLLTFSHTALYNEPC